MQRVQTRGQTLSVPQPSSSPSLWNLLAGRMLAQLDFWYDGDGDNYNYDDHTEKEEGDKDKKTKPKTMTMMMAVVMTLTRPVLLSITLKVVGQRNLGRGGPVRAPRLGISHHPGLSTGH